MTATSCSGQPSHENDQIIITSEFKRGVVSEDGTVVIDSVYQDIRRLTTLSRLTLPPTQSQTASPIDYYLVTDSVQRKALFQLNGELAADAVDRRAASHAPLVRHPTNDHLAQRRPRLEGQP